MLLCFAKDHCVIRENVIIICQMSLCFDPQGHRRQDIIFCEILTNNFIIIISSSSGSSGSSGSIVVLLLLLLVIASLSLWYQLLPHTDLLTDLYFGGSGRKSPAVLWRSDGGGSRP